MTQTQYSSLRDCTRACKGRPVYFKHKGTNERYLVGTVEDLVSVIVSDYSHMIQRIKLAPDTARLWSSRYAYRTCYYTLTKNSRKPAWGQFHAAVSESVYRRLARKAHAKGWLGIGIAGSSTSYGSSGGVLA